MKLNARMLPPRNAEQGAFAEKNLKKSLKNNLFRLQRGEKNAI